MAKQSKQKNSAQKMNPEIKLQLKGRFIVIEGTDGSGKGTQVELLRSKLQSADIPHEIVDFPRYDHNPYGKIVGRYLKGEFGGVHEVSPYLACIPYTVDRLHAKIDIENWLTKGNLVIGNRYVPSHAYMAAKLPPEQRMDYIDWVYDLEYGFNGIPKEELVILLYADPETTQKNVDKKGNRGYLGNKKRDIHEDDLRYQSEVAALYLELAKREHHWHVVNCLDGSAMRSREDIHEEIMRILVEKRILSNS
jgi:dTMP kinase